jgi:nitrogen regulatory protein PII
MNRIEIIANRSVEENILEGLAKEEVGKFYTMIPSVFGVGACGPRMGTAVWPEENFALIIWCEDDEAESIKQAIAKVKEKFPGEGIKLFIN